MITDIKDYEGGGKDLEKTKTKDYSGRNVLQLQEGSLYYNPSLGIDWIKFLLEAPRAASIPLLAPIAINRLDTWGITSVGLSSDFQDKFIGLLNIEVSNADL